MSYSPPRTKALFFTTSMIFLCSHAALADWYTPQESPAQRSKAFVIYQKAMEAFAAGDDNATLQLCKQAENYSHGDKNLIHLEALAYARSGDNYNAMMKFRSALTLDYNFIPCRNNYGLFLRRTGKTQDAQKQFEECIKVDPRYPDAYYHLGEIIQEKGDLDKAIELYETATRLNPNYFEAQRDLGLAIYERFEQGQGGDIAESIEKLQTAAKLFPDNSLIHYHLGNVFCSDGKLDEGEAEFRTALTHDSKCAPAHWELARVRYLRGDPNRCLWEIGYGAKVNPVYTESKKYPKVDPYAMARLAAKCYEVEDRLEEAVSQWREVGSMQRNNEETIKHIAELEKILRANAKHHSKKGPAFDPAEVYALVKKGIGQVDDGDLEGAKATFRHALELNPDSFDATQNLGAVLEATGDLNGASVQYQKAMQLEPRYDGLLYNFAYLLEKMNLAADAGLEYQKFHEMAGKYPYDPKHIVALQQEEARQRVRQEQLKKRGY